MTSGSAFTTIRADLDDGLATLTLARPDAGNAIDLTMAQELDRITTAWAHDRSVRAILLQGEGRTFCVGGDLKSFAGQAHLPAHLTEVTTHLHAALGRLGRMHSSTWTLPRLVGLRRALDLALTNRPVPAEDAVRDGLATRVVPDDELADEARALARALADGPTGALGATKRLLRDSVETGFEVQTALESASLATAAGTADAREGITAFLEKRPPAFTGEERW
jgi:2-(1,2-epoxy-1,2-dihydrophenyl)acetyl-CoA isomerase